jgi:folate-binding protein YgfZ
MLFSESVRSLKSAIDDVALFSLTGRTHIEITGADRASFLHNFCTNHIKGLAVGQGCEAIVTSIKGRILFHVLVFAAAESLWIETEPGYGPALIAHLDQYLITEDVQLFDRTETMGQLHLSGAGVEGLLSRVFDTPVTLPANYGQTLHEGVLVRRWGFGSAPGVSIVAAKVALDSWRSKLLAAGAVAASHEIFEALRIENGFPKHGVDISEDHLAQEANRTKLAISFAKGCYLGQEPIARIDALGHVNRLLCGVTTDEPAEFAAGSEVFATRDAPTPAGTLTSAAVWPLTERGIGLGMLRREIARDGAECYVGPTRIPAHVRLWSGR